MSENDTIQKFDHLLEHVKTINWDNKVLEPTFLDIAGFPHYENVCSNILAFFFQTDAEHNLKDLFLKAMLNCLTIDTYQEYNTNDVLREASTDTGRRLDLVIETDDLILGIENKIYAGLYNDLDDYSTYLLRKAPTKEQYKVVLSLTKVDQNSLRSGFINVTYPEFLGQIDQLMGYYWKEANQKYLILLNDFNKNIEKLIGGKQMEQEMIDFFVENGEDIEKLMQRANNYKKYLRETLNSLSSQLASVDEKLCKRWFYRVNDGLFDDLVHDFYIDGAVIALDTVFQKGKYKISIWLRKPGTKNLTDKAELTSFLIDKGFEKREFPAYDGRHVYTEEFTDQQDVVNKLNEMIGKICS